MIFENVWVHQISNCDLSNNSDILKKYDYLIHIFDCKLMTENTGPVYVQCILTKSWKK